MMDFVLKMMDFGLNMMNSDQVRMLHALKDIDRCDCVLKK